MAEVKTVTISKLAHRLKIDPKQLRAIMRSNGMHRPKGKNYKWKEGNPALAKIAAMVAQDRKSGEQLPGKYRSSCKA